MNKEDRTIKDLNILKLNKQTAEEFNSLKNNAIDLAIENLEELIDNLRYKNGRKIRLERRISMIKVLRVLYLYLKTDDKSSENYGECSPSMRLIAYNIEPSLEQIEEKDSKAEIKRKEKELSRVLMYVQRTIKVLEQFGIIKTHVYRSESNRNDDPENYNVKNPNFYYELVPVSSLCKKFAELVKSAFNAVFKLSAIVHAVKKNILKIEEVAMKAIGLEPKPWTFKPTTFERNIRKPEVLII